MTSALTPRTAEVPPFLVLAGDPLRWRLLVALAESDRQVGELTRAVGQPQGLVSYHLARLREGGLVSSRKSSFDGRAVYYRVHLERCGTALASTGAALHPGLASDGPSAAGARQPGRRSHARVLFVCTGNGTRSQIAEALLRHRAGDRIGVASAGSHPKPVHPNTVRVLAELGIDASGARSKPISQFDGRHFDMVVTLCDRVREVCPEFPGQRASVHWSIADPGRAPGSPSATLPAFRAVAADLDARIGFLLARLDHDATKEHTNHGR